MFVAETAATAASSAAMFNPFSVAMGALNIYEGITTAQSNRAMAKSHMKSIQKQMDLTEKHREELKKSFGAQRGVVKDIFGADVSSLFSRVSQNMLVGSEQFKSSQAQSGLGFSGTLKTAEDIRRGGLKKEFGSGHRGLVTRLDQKMLNLEAQELEAYHGLDMQMVNLEGQYDIAKQQSQERYLGIF